MILISLIYSSKIVLSQNATFRLNELDGVDYDLHKTNLAQWPQANVDMSSLIQKIGVQAGIPKDNIIDSERYIKYYSIKNSMVDAIHPNEVGYGALAQEIYMRLAFSPSLK